MSGAVETYLAKLAEFRRIEREIINFANLASSVGNGLKNWPDRFHFSGTQVGLPADVVLGSRGHSQDGSKWRNAEEIMQMLSKYHSAKQAAQAAWSAVPREFQNAIEAPDIRRSA